MPIYNKNPHKLSVKLLKISWQLVATTSHSRAAHSTARLLGVNAYFSFCFSVPYSTFEQDVSVVEVAHYREAKAGVNAQMKFLCLTAEKTTKGAIPAGETGPEHRARSRKSPVS